jgi:hypothetical protein
MNNPTEQELQAWSSRFIVQLGHREECDCTMCIPMRLVEYVRELQQHKAMAEEALKLSEYQIQIQVDKLHAAERREKEDQK